MKDQPPHGLASALAILCCLAPFASSCRKTEVAMVKSSGPKATIAAELRVNELAGYPGAVYQSESGSQIHWQPWTPETLERAKKAHRLVFAVIAMPQQGPFQDVLKCLESDPRVLEKLNESYVPVLVDGDASREMGILTADLCGEIERGVQLPLFVWLSPAGDPVAWIPVAPGGLEKVVDVFEHSHSMVSKTWDEDPDYVYRNSAMDNANRRERFLRRQVNKVASTQPAVDAVRALRQLASLYDPYSHNFDEAGGLFPSSSIELLGCAAVHPGLPPEVRSRCLATVRGLTEDLLNSAMLDPLDGGVFSSRRRGSWALPMFTRDCLTQARAAVALIASHRATGDSRALDKALGLISFAERSYGTPEGLFAVGLAGNTDPDLWLWRVEDVEKSLPPDVAAWWIKTSGMKGLGNLPSESDPKREFFRMNSLAIPHSLEDMAAEQGVPVDVFKARFDAMREKLLAVRNARMGKPRRDVSSNAGATFRMVSAYVAAFTATGDDSYREKAVALLTRAKVAFSDGPRIRVFPEETPASVGAGRAFHYGLAMQAALDVAAVTSNEDWLIWTEDLATTAAELFTGTAVLKECPDNAKLIDLPVTDLVMLFDDSTAGLVSSAECRLAQRNRPLVRSFSQLATPLPVYTVDRPILHTDLLQATLARHFHVNVLVGADVPSPLIEAVEQLHPRMIQRRKARPDDKVPSGSVKVILPGGESRIVSESDELQQAVLPSSEKS